MSNQEGLSKGEQEELKTLQTARKESGGHITDSERARLSELQGKEPEQKEAKAAAAGKK